MFYKIQFNDIQAQIAARLAAMAADLAKYSDSPKATAAAIETRTAILTDFNNYHNFMNSLYMEFIQAEHETFAAGYEANLAAVKRYEPEQIRRTNNNELDRFNSITRARLTWPELF